MWFGSARAARKNAAHCARYFNSAVALAARAPAAADGGMLVSFLVPLVEARTAGVDELLRSFQAQRPGSCELVLCGEGASDPRRLGVGLAGSGVVVAPEGAGVAAGLAAGLAAARAPWIARLDPDGALAPFAVDRLARALSADRECRWLYTDEVLAERRMRPIEAWLKPAWDPILLESIDYPGRLSIYRRDRLIDLGGWREHAGRSPDHDLALRYSAGLEANAISHLPYPAFLRRCRAPIAPPARAPRSNHARPRVSVVVPSRDSLALIRRVLDGLLNATDYREIEVFVIDNGTTDPEVAALYADLAAREPRFRFHIEREPFNFSRAINRGVAMTSGELVLLLNNDVEVLDPGWLTEMVVEFERDDVGVVGVKLLYPDRKLQHAGVIAGLGRHAGHWFIGQGADFAGPMGRLAARQSLSVVTAACMLVSRRCLEAVGPFDERIFPIAYNDVDFCLRAIAKGFRVVWTPFATLVHHESASRGSDETPENIARFNRDKANLRERHQTDVLEDRAFNPWYSRGESVPHPVALDRLPEPR
jgi:GT2 family glycosyltransferase